MMMEKTTPESCQKCFKPISETGAEPKTQWITICRCARPYDPKAQFSIDICMNCNMRVGKVSSYVDCHGLCHCDQAKPISVPNYIKQNDADTVKLDASKIGIDFPIERYHPIAILGQGHKASVTLCRDKQRGTKVAVKCFRKTAPEFLAAFEQEYRKLSKLTHTNIAKVTDFGIYNQVTPYIVTEYKDGFNLNQCLALHGTPSHEVAVMILLRVCEALMYAQKEGFLHRNIKPENIIFFDDMNSEPAVLVLDFSSEKLKSFETLSESSDAMYMSSDDARNMPHDERSEVYTLGCIGYTLLTGRAPFPTGSARDIKNKHALELPPQISRVKFEATRPTDLEDVISRCLEKDPKVRFDTIAKLSERLEVFPNREKMRIAAILGARRREKLTRVAAIVFAVLIVCSLVGFFFLSHH